MRRDVAEVSARKQRTFSHACRRAIRELAFHDWLVGGFVAFLAAAAIGAAPHPLKARAAGRMTGLAVAVLGGIVAVRGGLVRPRRASAFLYRTAVLGGVLGPYFVLRDLLPVVSPHSLDHGLYALDVALFGGEPAVWMQAFVTPATTEWFAFFYLSYFPLLACFTLPIAYAVDREDLLAEFATGMILVYCVGQTLYLVVPGFGPHAAFPEIFATPLPPGRWHDALMRTVAAAGSQKDIFPSLHTAGPLFMTLFAFRHRREPVFRIAWPIAAFFAVNIVVATLLLRWHYAIDVVAGAALGVAASLGSTRLPAADAARRRTAGRGPLWPPVRRRAPAAARTSARSGRAHRPSIRSHG